MEGFQNFFQKKLTKGSSELEESKNEQMSMTGEMKALSKKKEELK